MPHIEDVKNLEESFLVQSYEHESIAAEAQQLDNLVVAEHEQISTSSKYFTAKEGEDSNRSDEIQP